jgi:hypothetical protein
VITCDKLAERALTALLLMPVAWFAYVALSFAWDSMALERFYRDRPILQAMRMAHDDPPSVESAAAAEALLRYVPLGTDATAAIAILSGEDLAAASRRRRPSTCSAGTRASGPFGFTIWTVELQFDASALLSGAKVTKWNIFL